MNNTKLASRDNQRPFFPLTSQSQFFAHRDVISMLLQWQPHALVSSTFIELKDMVKVGKDGCMIFQRKLSCSDKFQFWQLWLNLNASLSKTPHCCEFFYCQFARKCLKKERREQRLGVVAQTQNSQP